MKYDMWGKPINVVCSRCGAAPNTREYCNGSDFHAEFIERSEMTHTQAERLEEAKDIAFERQKEIERLRTVNAALLEEMERLANGLDHLEDLSRSKYAGYTVEAAMYELRGTLDILQRKARHAIALARGEEVTA